MNFVANNLGDEGKRYSLKKPTRAVPNKLRKELVKAGVGRICYADERTHHELLGEICQEISPSSMGDLTCDDMWAMSVAAEWPTESEGEWLCGQGHKPASITMDTCPTMGCSVLQRDLAEVAARSWICAASSKAEVMPLASVSFDNGEAAKIFAETDAEVIM